MTSPHDSVAADILGGTVTGADALQQPASVMKMVEGDVRYKSCQT
jgi:hypothetical protein